VESFSDNNCERAKRGHCAFILVSTALLATAVPEDGHGSPGLTGHTKSGFIFTVGMQSSTTQGAPDEQAGWQARTRHLAGSTAETKAWFSEAFSFPLP